MISSCRARPAEETKAARAPKLQSGADFLADLLVQRSRSIEDTGHPEEPVDHAVVTAMGDGNAGDPQRLGIAIAVVAERIKLGGRRSPSMRRNRIAAKRSPQRANGTMQRGCYR